MSIVNQNYERYNIGKLPRNRYSSNGSSSLHILSGSGNTGSSSKSNVGAIDGHYLWGNYFDGTQDIEGTLDNVQDINMSGDINIEGDIVVGPSGTISGPNAEFAHATIDDLDGGTATINEIYANTGDINYIGSETINNSGKITTDDLEANSLSAVYGYINTLRSQDIRTHDLTVDGSAHFFELIIDKIKSVGGNIILTPADGFKIEAIYSPAATQEILYFLAEDNGKKIHNMWEVGDQAIIQNFNKAVSGTSYNVDNTYYWGDVVGVSTQAGPKNGADDGRLYHYIVVSRETGKYDGSLNAFSVGNEVVMLGHKKRSNETDADAKKRQSAIYMSAYTPATGTGGYDEDLIAPSLVYYEGINTFELAPYKKQWWSSGVSDIGQQRDIPQNMMRGTFLLQNGDTIKDYIDQNIKDADINMITVDAGSNVWFVNTDANYNIINTSQTWSTNVKIKMNGEDWHINNNGVILYIGGSPAQQGTYTVTYYDDQGTVILPSEQKSAAYVNITINSMNAFLPGWYGTENRIINATIGTYNKNSVYTDVNFDITCVKLAAGQNGDATTVVMDQYSLTPVRENAWVDATGKMALYATYTLKHVHTDNDGYTVMNTEAQITNDFSVSFEDDRQQQYKRSGSATVSGNSFIISINNYLNGAIYEQLWKESNQPNYITIYLRKSGTIIDKHTINIQFLTGSVFDAASGAFRLAVADSKLYTDGQITGVQNSISSLTLNLNGISTRVGSLEQEYDDLSGMVSTKADISYVDQSATGIISVVQSTETRLQNNIDDVDGRVDGLSNDLELNYLDAETVRSEIAQSATGISFTIEREVNDNLYKTGIDIENGKININATNTNFNSNINLYDPNDGLILYDENGVPRVGLINSNVAEGNTIVDEQGNIIVLSEASIPVNNNKVENKSSSTTQSFTHTMIPIGKVVSGDGVKLIIYNLNARITDINSILGVNAISFTYSLYKGNTLIEQSSAPLSMTIYHPSSGVYYGSYNIVSDISREGSGDSGDYFISYTITYTLINAAAGTLGSSVNFMVSNQNDYSEMIGRDGVNFKAGQYNKIKLNNATTYLSHGWNNYLNMNNYGMFRCMTNLNNMNDNVARQGDISSSYPFRVVSSGSRYNLSNEDAIVQSQNGVNFYLPGGNGVIGKEYYLLAVNGAHLQSGSLNIYLNGSTSGEDDITMTRMYLYHAIRFPYGWIITTRK